MKKTTLKQKLFGVYVFIAVEFFIYYTLKTIIPHKGIVEVIRYFLIFLPILLVMYGFLKAFKKTFVVDGVRFSEYDMVIDTGSKIRNDEVGVLKRDDNGWFIIYFDGFEAKITQLENLVKKG